MKNSVTTNAKEHMVNAVHHRIVHVTSLYLCLDIRPGSGSENTERDKPSRGRRDSVRDVRVGSCGSIRFGGGDIGDSVEGGVGEREGKGDVWWASQPPCVLGASEARRGTDALRPPSPSSSSSLRYGSSTSSSPRKRGSPWSSSSRSSWAGS